MDGVHNSHDDFVNSQWVEMGSLHQQHGQHPLHPHHSHDFGTYGFVESPGFAPPDSHFRLQQPIPLAPNYLGVSQWGQPMAPPITSHPHFIHPPAIAPMPASDSAPMPTTASTHSTQSSSTPRRTLTDSDRRRMCIFHEENPNVKQTEIGAMFGVERSTVSKVLRQKEKYLYPDDGSRSPIKRSRGKFPDIERALSVWAKNTRKQGVTLTDMMIREKARFFATSVGISDSHFKANSAGWLEKFKQKNNLHSNGRGRSESDVTGAGRGNACLSPRISHARTDSTPAMHERHESPMRNSKSQDSQHSNTDSPESYMDFTSNGRPTSGSTSTSPLSSMFTDTRASSFSAGPASPTSPFFSPEAGSERLSPLFRAQHSRPPHIQQRPRSQTFPLISVDPTYISTPPSSEPITPKMLNHIHVPPPALASPIADIPNPLASPHDTPTSSHGAFSGHGTPHTPMGPSKDDARRALETVMSFLSQQPEGFVEPDDYFLVGKLLGRFGLDGAPTEADHHMFTTNGSPT